MSTIKYPKIISVTGAHSKVGKTTLCSILLNEFKGFGAIKFTKTPEHRAQSLPTGQAGTEHRQTEVKKIRSSEDKNFSTSQLPNFPSSKVTNSELIEDLNILNQKGKDTAIFLESGAERVIWIQSPYYELENILKTALGKMADLEGLVIEGNSPVDFLNPHLIIFIIGVDGEIKPSALEVSKKADIIIINSEKHVKELSFLSTLGRKGAKVFYINLLNRKGELDKFLCFVKEKINQGPP